MPFQDKKMYKNPKLPKAADLYSSQGGPAGTKAPAGPARSAGMIGLAAQARTKQLKAGSPPVPTTASVIPPPPPRMDTPPVSAIGGAPAPGMTPPPRAMAAQQLRTDLAPAVAPGQVGGPAQMPGMAALPDERTIYEPLAMGAQPASEIPPREPMKSAFEASGVPGMPQEGEREAAAAEWEKNQALSQAKVFGKFGEQLEQGALDDPGRFENLSREEKYAQTQENLMDIFNKDMAAATGMSEEEMQKQTLMLTKAGANEAAKFAEMMAARGMAFSGMTGKGFGDLQGQTMMAIMNLQVENAKLAIDERINKMKNYMALYGQMLSEANRMEIYEKMSAWEKLKYEDEQDQLKIANMWTKVNNILALTGGEEWDTGVLAWVFGNPDATEEEIFKKIGKAGNKVVFLEDTKEPSEVRVSKASGMSTEPDNKIYEDEYGNQYLNAPSPDAMGPHMKGKTTYIHNGVQWWWDGEKWYNPKAEKKGPGVSYEDEDEDEEEDED